MLRQALIGSVVAGVLLALGTTGAGAGSASHNGNCITGRKVGNTIRYCGPATARLSKFPGVVFKNGTCHRTTVNGHQAVFLKLGARSLSDPITKGGRNGGLTYYDVSIIGPFSHATGGGVIAFYKGRHWYGRGTSFKGSARGGRFTARGIAQRGSTGAATGSFRC
jgi:hypothetical protein